MLLRYPAILKITCDISTLDDCSDSIPLQSSEIFNYGSLWNHSIKEQAIRIYQLEELVNGTSF